MGFLNAVSLLVVFFLGFSKQTEAVPANKENVTAHGNTTLTPISSNVTGGSINQTFISQTLNTTRENENRTNYNIESVVQPTSRATAFPEYMSYGETYKSILHTLQLDHGLKVQNLNILLQKLGTNNCSKQTKHKCITTRSLLKLYNIKENDSITDNEFSQMSTMIFYSLLPASSNSQKILTTKVDVYEEMRKRYSTNSICEQILDQVLNDLNESIGNQLTNTECFSANELFQELNISVEADIDKTKIPELSMIIVSKLLQSKCINVNYENPLPCSSYFVNSLFKEYAKNNSIDKKNMKKLMEVLKIGKQRKKEHDNKHDPTKVNTTESDDKLVRKRRDISKHSYSRISKRATELSHHNHHNRTVSIYKKCYSAEELFSIYHVNQDDGFKMKRFESLSVALLDQIESSVCFSVQNDNDDENNSDDNDGEDDDDNEIKKVPEMSVWGFGLAAVSGVSLISLFMIIPLLRTTFFKKSLVFLISLAIGTLVGDSMFHLLPRATGVYGKDKDYFWRFFSVLGGIYGFFIFETTAHLLLRKTHTVQITPKNKKYIERNTVPSKTDDKNQNKLDVPSAFVVTNKMNEKETPPKFANGNHFDMEDNIDDEKPIAPMAWTVIIGDTLHNIADGIAIGVAFSDSIAGGVSTSIAVLCHEVPHELGDFVVLLSAGMSVRQAVIANFVSSCFCFIGLVFGKMIYEIEDANLWILGVTGGFFLYIALTNKLPELMHVTEQSDQSKITLFLLQNIGVIVGFIGMFFLAYYKKDINI